MFPIDVTIVNKSLEHLGRLNRNQEILVLEIDRRRQHSPYTRLNTKERGRLKEIGRIFDIYPDETRVEEDLYDRKTKPLEATAAG